MARFALLLPREEMVEPAGRIARELEMDVVLNQSVPTERILDLIEDCRRTGADILVARGRQASILKEHTDFPVVEIQLTGLEIARLLHRARSLVSHLERPKIGVVTIPNMVGNIQGFEEIFDIELHTYFISGLSEMERGAEQAVADGMDVILGGDFVNAYCRRLGKRTLFFDGTEDSLRTSLLHARNVGQVADAERRNTAHLQVLLDYSFNGILELDARGIIVQSNDVACKILEQEREKLVGLPLSTLMPREDAEFWADALAQRRELYFSVLNVAGVHVVANAAPVADWDAGEGMVFSFYEMQKMERQGERALRERYRLQRYLAHGRFEDVNHTSREMSRLVKLARTFAETGQPILVYGEVGSGKSLFAQSIHNASPCSKGQSAGGVGPVLCQQLRRKALRDIKGIGVGPFGLLRLLQIGPVGPADVNPAGFPNDLRGQAGVVGVEMGEGHIYIPGVHIQLRQPGKQSAAALLLSEAGIDKQAALPPAEQVAVQFPERVAGQGHRNPVQALRNTLGHHMRSFLSTIHLRRANHHRRRGV